MSFFKKTDRTPSQQTQAWSPPAHTNQRGDRTLAQRVEYEAQIAARENGTNPTSKVDRKPNGCLFKVAGGFFDKDGFWCVRKSRHEVEVMRGAPRKIMEGLTETQKSTLNRVRLAARRAGIR